MRAEVSVRVAMPPAVTVPVAVVVLTMAVPDTAPTPASTPRRLHGAMSKFRMPFAEMVSTVPDGSVQLNQSLTPSSDACNFTLPPLKRPDANNVPGPPKKLVEAVLPLLVRS